MTIRYNYKNNFVYLIYNKVTKKMYIGTKSSNDEPKDVIGVTYFSSSCDDEFMNEQKEHPENFKYRVLKNFDKREDAINLEIFLHKKYKVAGSERFYNLSNQTSEGWDTTGVKYSEERKKQISERCKQRYLDPEERLKTSITSKKAWDNNTKRKEDLIERNKNRVHTREEIEKGLKSRLDPITGKDKYSGEKASFWGKHHTEEHKKHMSEVMKGRKVSAETCKKISESKKAKHWHPTEEQRKRLSEASPFKGKKRSKEFCENLSRKLKGKKQPESAKELLKLIAKNRKKDCLCEYCGKYFTKQAYGQYHGEKCKMKGVEDGN